MSSPSPDKIDLDDDDVLNLLNSLPLMTAVLNRNFEVEFANKSFCQFVDKPPENVTGTNFLRHLPDETAVEVKQHLKELSPETPSITTVLEGTSANTESNDQEWTFELETGETASTEQYYAFARDLTETPLAEDESTSREKVELNDVAFREMANSLQEALWLMNPSWSEVLYANPACEEIYGVSHEALMQDVENWTKHIVPNDLDRLYNNLAPATIEDLSETVNVNFRLDHPEHGRRHINLKVSPIPVEGETKRLVGLASDVTQKEEKLRRSKQRFKAILDSTFSSLGLLKPDGSILEANQAALDMVDASIEELRGQYLWETPWWSHTGDLQDRVREAVQKAAEGETQRLKATYPLPAGEEIDAVFAIIPVENDSGNVEYLVTEGRNITEQKQLEQELERQRNFLDSIINTAQQGIFVKTWNGKFVLANETISEIFGEPREEIEGGDDYDFLDEEVADGLRETDRLVLKKGEPLQFEEEVYHEKHGEVRTFLTVKTPLFQERSPKDRLVLGITTDISRRKALQEELEKQKDFLQTIIDSAPIFIFVKDWNGVFQIANEELADFYDATPDDLLGQTDADFNPNKNEVETFLEDDREVMRSGETKVIPEEPVTDLRTGETHWFQTTKVPLFTDQPVEERQVLGVATEITEKKNIREQLEQSLQEKELLLGEIHHRVKNNLQIIQSILSMEIREREGENPALEDCINRIYSMALLHEKLYQSDTLDEGDISSYFDQLCQHLKDAVGTQASDVEISVTVDLGSIPIKDAVSCGLVVNELVTNALQHGFREGKQGCINVSFRSEEDGYQITVEDNGHGLPEGADITDVQSTGMRIIRSIVEYEFQGDLNFQDDDGVTVTVTL